MRKINTKNGVALISILAITAIALILISVLVVISIVNKVAESLIDEAVLRYVRFRSFTNPYPDWTENCLQISNVQCKMNYEFDQSGGTIDAWGKSNNFVRHLQVQITVAADESASISARKEIY
jgi:hypothetical protein